MATTETTVSSRSSSSNCGEESRAVTVSNTISGNVARDAALQLNGDIAGTIINLNV